MAFSPNNNNKNKGKYKIDTYAFIHYSLFINNEKTMLL